MVTVLVSRAVSCCFLFCLWERSCLVVVDHLSVRAFICMLRLFVKHGCVLVLDGCWFSVMLSSACGHVLCLRYCSCRVVVDHMTACAFSCFAMCFKLARMAFASLNDVTSEFQCMCSDSNMVNATVHIAVLG